jgi:lipopolysaccharide/colanic/teichoic acid biosynthesis glycosyltransferase
MTFYARFGKRFLDVGLVVVTAFVWVPIGALVALVVRLGLGKPVLYRQVRPGLQGKPFTINKFRTMKDLTDSDGTPLADAERMTTLGSFLRRTSLDELPALVNVLRGEMSLVGPRPLLVQYLDRYSPEQARRHEVKPGMTGWAQVNGRNGLEWDERLAMDVWYVDNLGALLDLKILGRTISTVLSTRDVSQPGEATMREFEGNHG